MATIVIATQFMENYGAHSWDGEGACPQRWKCKGGSDFKVRVPYDVDYEWMDIVIDRVLAKFADEFEWSDDYSQSYIVGTSVEADDFITYRERLQLEFDGKIMYPDPVLEYTEEEYA